MAVSGRTSKVSSVIATLCIMIYVVAVVFGVVRVVVDIGERRNLANREFEALASSASSYAMFLGFLSNEYQESIRDFLVRSHTLMGVIITSPIGDFSVERGTRSNIIRAGDSPRFRTGTGFQSQPLFRHLNVEGHSNVSIEVIYNNISNAFLIRVLRDTLLAVLAALAMAFITLIVELTQKNRLHAVAPNRAEPEPRAKPPIPTAEGEDNPHGLFTARGNIGWESYTHDRLSSELHRCASFEQDLVFIAMEFYCEEAISDSLYNQFANEAVTFFTMRDLIFERGEKGISIIIPSTALEQGMAKSEEFRNRIAAKMPESFGGRDKLYMGLSSRSGRLIEAERLIMEAATALEKTQEEPVSHMVAFKSDPEKYRKFIRRRL